MNDFKEGQYIIYHNGDRYEIGRIKSLRKDGAFVAYHEGETGAKTNYVDMHPLINDYCIEKTTLGGGYFEPEAVYGKWIQWRENGLKRCKCSKCLASYGNLDTPYCPNCGAKMYAEREEEE